jgi:hypothetical protein
MEDEVVGGMMMGTVGFEGGITLVVF